MTDDNHTDDAGSQSGETGGLHDAMLRMRNQCRATRWKVFHNPHQVNNFKNEYKHLHYHDRELTLQATIDIPSWDLIVFDMDYGKQYEKKNHNDYLIVQANKPLQQFIRPFQDYLKRLVPKLEHVKDTKDLEKLGYQLQCDHKLGALVVRMPDPEHMLNFSSQLCEQQYLGMMAHELTYQFSRALQARYDLEFRHHPELKPAPDVENNFQVKPKPQPEKSFAPKPTLNPNPKHNHGEK